MKAKDIKVGAVYTNLGMSGSRYLGIGKRVMWEGTLGNNDSNFTNKKLICLDEGYEGQIVQSGNDVLDGFWDDFVLVSKTLL